MSGVDFYALPESEQALQIADDELESLACPQCGRSREECGDGDKDWYPQRHICYPTMVRASIEARYDKLHDALPFHDGTFTTWAKERSAATPYHYRDGVTIFVAAMDLNPSDDFLAGPALQADEEVESDTSDPR